MIIAGETSGDIHGAGVVRELKRKVPSVEIYGVGGENMKKEGMHLVYHVNELSFMGFIEVVKHLPLIRSVELTLEQLLRMKRPDVVLFIDYPGFNLRFARRVKSYGIKTMYYISPQVWAWKKGRIKKIRSLIDMMLVVFPFEVPMYERAGVPVRFVGHPLVEEMNELMSKEQFFKRYGINPDKSYIAVIPGSRKQEIVKLLSLMVRAATGVAGEEKEVVVAVAPGLSIEQCRAITPHGLNVHYVQHATHEVMKYSEFAFVTSGTATLETACSETPMVVVYKTSQLTYWIARLVVRIKNIALVNIVAGKRIVPELVQHHATVETLIHEAKNIIDFPERYAEMKKNLQVVRDNLGTAGASAAVAQAILAP